MIEYGNYVVVNYVGKLTNGTTFDTSIGRDPLKFKIGESQVIPGFEKGLIGRSKGDNVTLTIPVNEAYGDRRDDLIIEVPLENLPENCKVGDQLVASQGDQNIPVTVYEISDSFARIDANHPLAGESLIFEIEIVDVQ